MKKTRLALLAIVVLFIMSQSCVYHDLNDITTNTHTDELLFDEISTDDGFSYYQNGNTLQPASPSPHGMFRLRFNDIAWTSLENGELPEGESFPNGAVVVKEVYNGNTLVLYAVMKKARSEINAGEGWLWAEYKPDGAVAFTLNRRGNGCISCHSDGPNRDLLRTFDLH